MIIVQVILQPCQSLIPASGMTTTFAVQIIVMTLTLAAWAWWVEKPLIRDELSHSRRRA